MEGDSEWLIWVWEWLIKLADAASERLRPRGIGLVEVGIPDNGVVCVLAMQGHVERRADFVGCKLVVWWFGGLVGRGG